MNAGKLLSDIHNIDNIQMNNNFLPDHEEILIFLEDNISKLVRLKVASRVKYKEYDENFMNYITADSCEDDERISLFSEQTYLSYLSMVKKLEDAINNEPELKTNATVKEYVKLLTGEE